ncbi:amidoligase family protein [Marinobacter fonticola]|uniref:amidoligase family protein n=1 Tax=Marinobacter fonticola TaxID=2603215 RepID=UPI0011E6CEC9|nr:amidoligase family protein [Marinobacter fonticola]
MSQDQACRMPTIRNTRDGKERRVGVEIEISGLPYDNLVSLSATLLEGKARLESRYVSKIKTAMGDYTIELDSDPIKDLDLQDERLPESIRELGGHAMEMIDFAAERIVPLEIITPPLPLSELETVEQLCDSLREAGALGSREALLYAFGMQLNPELPDLEPATLVNYFRAFAALYEWLKARHQIDISRKFTTYIEPWHNDYVDMIMEPDYAPDQSQLMRDYLHYNPTRNRALDLLPLFAHLDETLLREYVDDERVKARPTLHYRLPDCDIDNPKWHFSSVWNDWVVVEELATDPEKLTNLMAEYRQSRKLSFKNLTTSWKDRCDEWLKQNQA